MNRTRTMAAAALVALLAGCGTATHSSSATPAGPSPSANAQVCQKVPGQVAWSTGHAADGTLADAMKVDGWLRADASEATGPLRTDLNGLAAGFEQTITTGSTDAETSAVQRVAVDCAALGVDVSQAGQS